MYERMLSKDAPSYEEIEKYIGTSLPLLKNLEIFLEENYSLKRELKFPFGSKYGWGYKYSHNSSHICYVFFENEAFTVTIQLGDKLVPKIENAIGNMLAKTRELWEHRYPCGNFGGWLHYRVLNEPELKDIISLIKIKKSPLKKTHLNKD